MDGQVQLHRLKGSFMSDYFKELFEDYDKTQHEKMQASFFPLIYPEWDAKKIAEYSNVYFSLF